MHPYQGGYLRRKYRHDRRPELPVESPWVFYPRYLWNLVEKHVKLAKAVLHYRRIAIDLKRDPNARGYMDMALTPVVDDEFDSLELFTATAAAKLAVTKVRKPVAVGGGPAAAKTEEPFKIVQ